MNVIGSANTEAGFDIGQPLSWDAEFHTWTLDHESPLAGIDLNGLSPFLHDTIVNLRVPDWWRVITEPEMARDICELTLTSVGPNRNAVTEIVKTVARVRNLPAPDLGKGCPIALFALERVAACLIKRQLFEASASAVISKVADAEPGGE